MVVLATWTVVYHACLVLRLGVPWAVGLEALALFAWGVLARRARRPQAGPEASPPAQMPGPRPTVAERRLTVLTVATGAAAALLVAFDVLWPAIAALWLVAALAGTAWAALRLRPEPGPGPASSSDPVGSPRTEALVVLAWATGAAVLSMLILRPNPDDLYYVNLSQWVVDHGTFPVRDTIFSDLVFPMTSWPPIASYDALVGTLGRLAGVRAATVAYIVVPPIATFLSVLALWRLLRAWQVKAVAVAVSVAIAFLLFDGGPGYATPGNLFLTRMWQGKVILLCLLVPLLLVYALRYVERPTLRRAGWLFAGGVAATGLSTSAMFLVPLLALAGTAPLMLRRPRQALQGAAAMAAYPLGAGVVTVLLGGHSADLFGSRELYRFDPAWFGPEIFAAGPLAVIGVAAVLGGALAVPNRHARVTTGVAAAMVGLTFVPGVTQLSYDLVGLGPTLWRVSWIASVAALVGVLATWLTRHLPSHRFPLAAPLALVVVCALSGVPIWSQRSGAWWQLPPHWQRGPEANYTARLAIHAVRPGDVVLAPDDLAVTIAVLSTDVKTVAPRGYFMDYLRGEPGFHFAARLTLVNYANADVGAGDTAGVGAALRRLGVDEVCLPVDERQRLDFVRAQGYRLAAHSLRYRCLVPGTPGTPGVPAGPNTRGSAGPDRPRAF